MSKRQVAYIVIIAFIVGSVGSILFDRFFIPYLSTLPGLSGLRSFQSNAPIIINRREQIQLDEGVNLIELTKQASPTTVSIYSKAKDSRVLGSGIIFSSDGLIFSTREVLGNATEVVVVLNDGRVFDGLVRALDRKSEIAAVTITVNNLPVLPFEDAIKLQPAQKIVAVGQTSREFVRKFTSGFVSNSVDNNYSLERIFNSEEISELIETDASLQNDFVGGPVINLEGRLVGMVVNRSGKILTSEAIQTALNSYLATNKVLRPYYGIRYLSLSKSLATLRNTQGPSVVIASMDELSPLRRGRALEGDVITAVNGEGFTNERTFERIMNRQSGVLKLSIIRNNQPMELTINVELK